MPEDGPGVEKLLREEEGVGREEVVFFSFSSRRVEVSITFFLSFFSFFPFIL